MHQAVHLSQAEELLGLTFPTLGLTSMLCSMQSETCHAIDVASRDLKLVSDWLHRATKSTANRIQTTLARFAVDLP